MATYIPTPLSFALVLGLASAAFADSDTGAALFRRHCASCHGESGHGDGPAVPALKTAPPDLAHSTADVPALMAVIDGRRMVPAHGSRAMPVWGTVFEETAYRGPHAGRTALLATQALAEYVAGLQHPRR